MRVLVTGAAGFIGSAVVQALHTAGHDVAAVDALIEQAHPAAASLPAGVERADVRDLDTLRPLLRGVDIVVHQAAMVGAGTDAADLPLYASHNDLGTTTLLAAMAEAGVHRLVLASSMVVYGEGRYACPLHGPVAPPARDPEALAAGEFDATCPACGEVLGWELVDESAPMLPRSSYAASKVAQEHYAGAWARQADASVVALRYHNVYGPHMPQDTPYSGVAAIFRSALAAGQAPEVFEDGAQMRDFVHVRDVAAANALALAAVADAGPGSLEAYNVCSGIPVSIGEVARILSAAAGGAEPVTSGRFRASDVRHVVASPRAAADRLGFTAAIDPDSGLRAFVDEPLRPTR
ncbi:MAG TPA: NAD-dependent epimerase/dehydratase family protein [Nocardioidaceae bacterium]|nr:NAD-dependent epimerase/dehydratase family protein [Nocardioidaceae bacterium]